MAMSRVSRSQVNKLPAVALRDSLKKEKAQVVLDALVDAIGMATAGPLPIAKGAVMNKIDSWIRSNPQQATQFITKRLPKVADALPQAAYDPIRNVTIGEPPNKYFMVSHNPAFLDPGNPATEKVKLMLKPPRKDTVRRLVFQPDQVERLSKKFQAPSVFAEAWVHENAHGAFLGQTPKQQYGDIARHNQALSNMATQKGFTAKDIYDFFDILELQARAQTDQAMPLLRQYSLKGKSMPDDEWIELTRKTTEDATLAAQDLLSSLRKLPDPPTLSRTSTTDDMIAFGARGGPIFQADQARIADKKTIRRWLGDKGMWELWRPAAYEDEIWAMRYWE